MNLAVSANSEEILPVVLLFAGLWKNTSSSRSWTVLPWSPLPKEMAEANMTKLPKLASHWIMAELSKAIIIFDEAINTLWKSIWRPLCMYHLRGMTQRENAIRQRG